MTTNPAAPALETHVGSCHCGDLRFEVTLDPRAATRCNCTICTKLAIVGAHVTPAAFRLVAGDESKLGMYEWASKSAQRYFCPRCGVHAYGRGSLEQLGGAFVSINVNCLDDIEVGDVPIRHWDGRHDNWMAGLRDQPWKIFAAS